ncbi:MAG: hypothetical protein RQ982_09110, partial [Gammaproteobacteria bacterium]|nr:hypothetical protein [Gammaproteobacteria bacterium]
GDVKLSAIVICPALEGFPAQSELPDLSDLHTRMETEPEWEHRTVHGCELLLSPHALVVR